MKDRLIARAKPILVFLSKVMAEFNGDGAPRMAAAMAYYTIFQLNPEGTEFVPIGDYDGQTGAVTLEE